VRLKGKLLRLIIYPALAIMAVGCSGINVQKSVSPLDFILPGLMQADPAPADPDQAPPAEEPVSQVAQNQVTQIQVAKN
jgi:hypothetical protein